jgi:Zn-dependent protease
VLTALTVALVLFSVLAHELAHGYTARWQGDHTAERAGRLTWNPLKHVDPFATLALPLVSWLLSGGALILGGAKPVPVTPRNYRVGDQSDVIVSLAGVVANALILLGCVALLPIAGPLDVVLRRVIVMNAALILFNLLPIPPLDGWRVARCIVRARRRRLYAEALRFSDLESTSAT